MAREQEVQEEREELRERIDGWMKVPLDLLGIALIVVVVVEFSADLSPGWESALSAVNWFIYAVFTLNFLVQFALAPFKGRYLRRNWLAAVSVLLPALRALRVLRAVRAAARSLRLVRMLTATNRGTRSLNRMLRGYQFGRVLGLTVAVIAVGAAALAYFETGGSQLGIRYGDALWWATAFVTTIGSDFQPGTVEGRIVATLLVVWGLGVFGFLTGAVASYFVGQDAAGGDVEDGTGEEIRDLRQEVAELKVMLGEALATKRTEGREERRS